MGDRRVGEGGGGRGTEGGPPAKLSSLPTAIEKVKHTPTGGHVTIGEKDRSTYLPLFGTQPMAVVYVYFARAERCIGLRGQKRRRETAEIHFESQTDWQVARSEFTEIDPSEKRERTYCV